MHVKIGAPGLTGTFGHPDAGGPFPAILALGGSDGGTPEYFLNLLVPEGFAVLALVYWGTRETQPTLSDVPLERVESGLRWLREQANIRTVDGRVAVVGASKGAELALLAVATFPDLVGPVAAYTPSSVVWMGLDFSTPGRPCSTWTHNGVPVPFVPFPSDVAPIVSERGYAYCRSASAASTTAPPSSERRSRWSGRQARCCSCRVETIGCGPPNACATRSCRAWPRTDEPLMSCTCITQTRVTCCFHTRTRATCHRLRFRSNSEGRHVPTPTRMRPRGRRSSDICEGEASRSFPDKRRCPARTDNVCRRTSRRRSSRRLWA